MKESSKRVIGIILFCLVILTVIFGVFVLVTSETDTATDNCKELCSSKGEIFYKRTIGVYANDVCYCKNGSVINTYLV